MKSNKLFIIIFLTLLVLPLVLATDTYERNKELDLKIPFEVDGAAASPTATCNLSIQYPNSTYIISSSPMTNLGTGEFNYTISSTYLNDLGTYSWNAYCCDGTDCASGYGDFLITTTGSVVSLSNIILVLVFLALCGMFIWIGSSFSNEKFIIRTAFYLFAILMGVLSVNSARIIASESLDLNSMAQAGFILIMAVLLFMFLYIFIFALINVFAQVKRKNEINWRT